jgi:hypothetical protein
LYGVKGVEGYHSRLGNQGHLKVKICLWDEIAKYIYEILTNVRYYIWKQVMMFRAIATNDSKRFSVNPDWRGRNRQTFNIPSLQLVQSISVPPSSD